MMGYDLHVTRKRNWSDADGPTISLNEWLKLIAGDPELHEFMEVDESGRGRFASYANQEGALFWHGGEITSKNPNKAVIAKMAQVAATLGATVQGDDGEIYDSDGNSRELPVEAALKPGLFARLRDWLRSRRAARRFHQSVPPFRVGSRVRDPWGRRGTIIEANRKAMEGLGEITVRFDDGTEACMAYVASGLQPENG